MPAILHSDCVESEASLDRKGEGTRGGGKEMKMGDFLVDLLTIFILVAHTSNSNTWEAEAYRSLC